MNIDKIFYNKSIEDAEEIIKVLKDNGYSQIETVKEIRKRFNITLGEADKLVLYSKAWKENLDSNIKVRNDFFDAVEEIGKE